MEMISPESYIEDFKNCSIKELNEEKDRLCKTIMELEKIARHPEDSYFPYYDNDTKLSVYKDYLKKIEEVIDNYGENNDRK